MEKDNSDDRWKNRRSGSGMFGSLDEVFAPTKHEAQAIWEAKKEEIQQLPDTDAGNKFARFRGTILISLPAD